MGYEACPASSYKIPRSFELLHLFRCITQHFGVDLFVVLTQQRRSGYLHWRVFETH